MKKGDKNLHLENLALRVLGKNPNSEFSLKSYHSLAEKTAKI